MPQSLQAKITTIIYIYSIILYSIVKDTKYIIRLYILSRLWNVQKSWQAGGGHPALWHVLRAHLDAPEMWLAGREGGLGPPDVPQILPAGPHASGGECLDGHVLRLGHRLGTLASPWALTDRLIDLYQH